MFHTGSNLQLLINKMTHNIIHFFFCFQVLTSNKLISAGETHPPNADSNSFATARVNRSWPRAAIT